MQLEKKLTNFFQSQDDVSDTRDLQELSTFLFENQADLIEFDDAMHNEVHLCVNVGLLQ